MTRQSVTAPEFTAERWLMLKGDLFGLADKYRNR